MAREFDLIRRHFVRPVSHTVLGPGDDCALIQPSPGKMLAVSTDMLVEGTHFFPNVSPRDLGWKTLAVNVSDLAAMGAEPRWATLAGSLPTVDEDWLAAFCAGFFAAAERFGVDLIGGDTTQGPLNLCVTVLGEVSPGAALCRSAGQAGDDVWISGRPGLAALGLRHLKGETHLPTPWDRLCVAALQVPQPRVALGQALVGLAHAAIDVSDGLMADLGHIAKASGLCANLVLNQLPHLPEGVARDLALECLLSGGDDYELCFTAPVSARLKLAEQAAILSLPLWRIGELVLPENPDVPGCVSLIGPEGERLDWEASKGYEHFA